MRPNSRERRPGERAADISAAGTDFDSSTLREVADTHRKRRRIEVEFVNASCALVRGYGSRELITELRGRPPVWATLSRAWAVLPATAVDVIAIAESRRYEILVSGDRAATTSSYQRDVAGSEVPDPGAGLW